MSKIVQRLTSGWSPRSDPGCFGANSRQPFLKSKIIIHTSYTYILFFVSIVMFLINNVGLYQLEHTESYKRFFISMMRLHIAAQVTNTSEVDLCMLIFLPENDVICKDTALKVYLSQSICYRVETLFLCITRLYKVLMEP